ncbi:MAG: hypothetical protein ACSHYA_20370 [Opitutaceae bacterium]
MNEYLVPTLCILAGAYFLTRNVTYLFNESKFEAYMKTSPKAKLWVDRMGFEKACHLTKRVFLPLGIAVSAGLLGVGAFNLLALL